MKTKLKGILTLFIALAVQLAFAQQTYSGQVKDKNGEGALGVLVQVKGTNTGTQTDFDGNYSIQANPGDVLVFSSIEFNTKEVTLDNNTTVNVVMDDNSLNDIVIVGYRTTTSEKSNVASSIVSDKTIENRPNANVLQTLAGQVPGLDIRTGSGQPGADSTINLRGIGSINGNNEPLFVIDGAFVDDSNFRSLNPQDIKSVTTLRDVAATAIYGNRGANGVIVIETRQGAYDQPLKIQVNSISTFNKLQDNDYDYMNSQQLLTLERERGVGLGGGVYQQTGVPLTDAEIAAASTTDWREEFFRTGVALNNNVSLSSGGKNSRQFTSIGFYDQEGILVDSDLKRFNLRSNVSGKSNDDKFNYQLNFTANYSESNEPNGTTGSAINRNYVLAGFQSVPWLSPSDYTTGADLLSPLLFANTPLFLLDRLNTYRRKEEEIKLVTSLNLSYKLTKDLTLRSITGVDYQNEVLTRAEQSDSFNALLFGGAANPLAGFSQQSTVREFGFNQNTSLNYLHTFADKHTVDASIFMEYNKFHLRGFRFFNEGLNPRTYAFGDGSGIVQDQPGNDFYVATPGADANDSGLLSYFGSVDYDYDAKYGITATLRRDGSSRFVGDNKWGTFYSVAGRWNIHKEAFLADNETIDVLKLRASYGTAGNQYVSLNNNFGIFSPSVNFLDLGLFRDTFGTGNAYAGAPGVSVNNFGIGGLTWETTREYNVGVDFEMFDHRLRGAVDMYYRDTEDLFTNTQLSGIAGTGGFTQAGNFGLLTNKGIDVSANYDVLRQESDDDFGLTVGVVANFNENIIRDLLPEDRQIIGTGREGGALGEYFTIRYAGVNPANGNVLFRDANGNLTENPDADADRVWLGKNLIPEFQGSFSVNLDYKRFFLETQWNFATGVDRFDNNLSVLQNPTNIGQFNVSTDLLNAWTPTNRNTDIPSLDATNINTFASDRYLTEADYLNLRFIQLGYKFDPELIKSVGMTNLNIFVNAENLATFSKWRGFDPATPSNGARSYPTPRQVSVGVELGF